ncbi:uncharacterized protein LOC124535528 isoform X2 [Vanessa cardui]|uniref:uncharacterized protein LOC124535528 isoform X2 n=1 Tax=Vanessa cardui TaxID=171605 RepID=UPI001F13DEE7|nr:uncharacterized protein LOC124535528 isoform X2 [Vanessa cardui]
MPEESKKTSQKGKSDPKEQRRKRQGRHNAAPAEKKVEKAPEPPKAVEPEKPAYVPPGPEFYQSLKRETDEILKITEEANSKYKKKEIQSNWAKYEMPIESYEEIEEQENLGADYETLIQASFSVGGHFQFKHEKSWDITTGPTPYDKYFDVNMENLNVALLTIPFYERNDFDISLFSESDIQSMDHRATKFKQKYYNDKKYTTPDLEAQERILNSLTRSDNNNETSNSHESNTKLDDVIDNQKDIINAKQEHYEPVNIFSNKNMTDIRNKESKEDSVEENIPTNSEDVINNVSKITIHEENNTMTPLETKTVAEKDNKSIENEKDASDFVIEEDVVIDKEKITKIKPETTLSQENLIPKTIELPKAPKDYSINLPKEPPKNPIIESPEDLEKWLDDFLDG